MNVLILSCRTGEGHNAAARAVAQYLRDEGVSCEFLDLLSLVSDNVSRRVEKTYVLTTRIPNLFGILYRAGRAISSPKYKSPVYWANWLYRDKLHAYLSARPFDAVVTSHLFAAEVLTSLKRENRITAKTVAIATDYTCIPFWEETECDYYIVPHKDLMGEYVEKGLPKEKLYPYGIPVSKPFLKKGDKGKARIRLGLPENRPVYLIMSGSMGFGRVDEALEAMARQCGNAVLVAVCGTNAKLKAVLDDRFRGNPDVIVKGFCKDVPDYMDACDVLFTKPGGLTSTEAAVKGIPLIHTAPIPGCETKNAAFFAARGMSYYQENLEEQLTLAKLLCEDEGLRRRMTEAQRQNTNAGAAKDIYSLLLRECPGKEVTTCLF